jgi:hypothetical protein
MNIDGITEIKTDKYSIFYIEYFSDELKAIIRELLRGIFHGFSEIEYELQSYTYKNTLISFLDRYKSKDENTKKGMIGELLSHILLHKQDNNFTSLSVLKNKEERSIKKGFDIVYFEFDSEKLWYSEVKSGNPQSENSTEFNLTLLNRAKTDIIDKITGRRHSTWESALIDVSLMLKGNDIKTVKEILDNDSPINENYSEQKNVILISVLYNDLNDKIDPNSINEHFQNLNTENFSDVIIVSIQKETYVSIANFLEQEAQSNEQ